MLNSKYGPLERYLSGFPASSWRATFADIEKVIGAPLPPSARRHRPWWSNNASNNVMTKAWKSAGWVTEQVDMENQVLVFKKIGGAGRQSAPDDSSPTPAVEAVEASVAVKKFDFTFGRLKGTVTWTGDLTEPAGEVWNAELGIL